MSMLDELVKLFGGKAEQAPKKEEPKATSGDKEKTQANAKSVILPAATNTKKSSSSTKQAQQRPDPYIPASPSIGSIPDPRQFQDVDPRSRDTVLQDFTSTPPVPDLLQSIMSGDGPKGANLEDNKPDSENIRIANDYTYDDPNEEDSSRADRFRTRDRSDLKPMMAFADFLTGGKSKLADAYTPPESMDSIFMNMMKMRESGIANRNKSELEKAEQAVNAYKKLAVDPPLDILRSMATLYQGRGGADAGVQKAYINAMQAGNNTLAREAGDNARAALTDSRARDISRATLKERAYEFNTRAQSQYESSGKPQDYMKQIDNEMATYLAPIFIGKALPLDRKQWSGKDQRAMGTIGTFVDAVVSDLNLDKSYSPHEARMRAIQMINMAKPDKPGGSWKDPTISDIAQRFKSGQ